MVSEDVSLEKWKNAVGKGQVLSALLTDISKGFNYLDHELSIVTLSSYGFTLPALRSILD